MRGKARWSRELLPLGKFPKDWYRVNFVLLLPFAGVEGRGSSLASQYTLYVNRSALVFDFHREEICLACNLCVVLLATEDVEV